MQHYHPGTCEATARGRRYGTNLTPQRYDDPGHVWSRAKTSNRGPWSCCGRPVNSGGCQVREARVLPGASRGVGAYVQFLINNCDRVLVVSEAVNCWILSTGRIAKKETEGASWVWAPDNSDVLGLGQLFSRLHVQKTGAISNSFYSFGSWGYHTNDHESKILPGFSPTQPGVELCGTYKIMFVAALRYDTNQQQANIFLRRQPKSGRLVIKKTSQSVAIGVHGRLGTPRPSGRVNSQAIFDGQVILPSQGHEIDRYFGPGYNFFGFGSCSKARKSYTAMASNAGLIVTKRNDNKGRIYCVDSPKAFKLVNNELGVVADESAAFDSQEHEANVARRICKSPHYSFLCRELGLPCSASALITEFIANRPPYIFAEPGDIWLDIRLTTPNRTYVLARRE